MPVILGDADIEGHVARISARLESADWREMTAALAVSVKAFRDVGLDSAATDTVVWRFCQSHGYYLLTGNRNANDEDSLEATLIREATATSLPVLSLSNANRVPSNATYLERVVAKLPNCMREAPLT